MEVLVSTRTTSCHCEDTDHMERLGLEPLEAGYPVVSLADLQGGCTTGRWVCPRLDNVRRRYGQ